VDEVGSRGLEALRADDAVRGEQLFRQALELAPNSPDLFNNLAAALALQGRRQEPDDLIRQVHERFPDYFFGRVGMARIAVRAGELDQAADYLRPLLLQRKLHVTELDALAAVEIEMALAKKQPEGAMKWFEILADLYPESPNLRALLEQVMPPRGWLDRLRRPRRRR
jgi:predicted Zn-dependent protease